MAKAANKVSAGGVARLVSHLVRAFRERERLTQKELGAMIGYSAAAISALETGAQPPSDDMLVKLEAVIGDGMGVFELARELLLLEKYPVRFRQFSQLEATAFAISSYETHVVDGLFQTEDYARALIRGGYPPVSEAKVEELVEARMVRKALFDRDPMAMIELILDESVLLRPFGSWEIHRGQLRSLVKDAQRVNVTVQVLPLERGLKGSYAGDRGAMKLVETKDHDHVVYMEIEDESILVSNRATVSGLAHRYAKIRAQALSPDESLGLIERLAGEPK
ncbi:MULTISPECIES: helix-turn-helix transcriptional regulator [unclassified Streptomyces]|uniref:helix-turn-helix domain-containing protein n=1 Tax=unclassified Streptomyces TaxID=2593676 RepID=UPI00224D7819|nr:MULTISPECIES: helix-turn-helix transcriptional regulator [unclassified Streptomyces]MCX4527107.1 helix-turn-helix transcriptional regulator [Streptomyces sp. NBC_01551]MCX4542317.1 helix-turn-helix transcriptional regulator [Streptomyces sp. NBC_01565]